MELRYCASFSKQIEEVLLVGIFDLKVIKTDVYSANFKQLKNGDYKTIAIFSKKARGMMTRFIVDNNISDIDNLKSFDYYGYIFHEELSTEKELIFTR